jgi:hypothetical protein
VEWKLVVLRERCWQPRFYTYEILVASWNQVAAGSLSFRNSGMTFFRVKYVSRQDFVRSRLLWLSTTHRSILSYSVNIHKYDEYNNVYMQGLFISPSGISDLCGTASGKVTPKGSMLTEGEILHFSVLPYRCSICPPLVTRQMSNLAVLADSKTQNASLIPVHAMFRHDCPLTVKLASTQWNLVNKINLERFCTYWYVPFCCVCLGCCAAEFESSGGTYELPCTSTTPIRVQEGM